VGVGKERSTERAGKTEFRALLLRLTICHIKFKRGEKELMAIGEGIDPTHGRMS
jgi:hypothetical protein